MKKAIIVQGGWDGHEPVQVADHFKSILESCDFKVELYDTLDAFLDEEKLMGMDIIIPVWTMGRISNEQLKPVLKAVENGVGIAGCHGGMCDSFRDSTEWQFMTGGQWVAHPGNDGVRYLVNIKKGSSPIVEGIEDFYVESEQYYMHVDPANDVLATTRFPVVPGPHSANGECDAPVIWTRRWGKGKVFYTSLGHHADIVQMPQVTEICKRGFLWAVK